MAKITYDDKISINENADIPAINKCQASDMNEIKNVINENYDEYTNIIPVDVVLNNVQGTSTYECIYVKTLNICFLRLVMSGVGVTGGESIAIANVPEQYRPSFVHALSVYRASDTVQKADVTTNGDVNFYSAGTGGTGIYYYVTGFWFVGEQNG